MGTLLRLQRPQRAGSYCQHAAIQANGTARLRVARIQAWISGNIASPSDALRLAFAAVGHVARPRGSRDGAADIPGRA